MPMKKQAVKIKAAAKGSVKAKKAVRVSHGYGHSSCKKKSGYGYKKKTGYGCKPAKLVCTPVKYICKPVKAVSKKRHKKVVRKSAFRANANQNQPITANNSVQVAFGEEVFDFGGEYNPATSRFRAKQSGVYTLFASMLFVTIEPPVFVQTSISVNGDGVLLDTENFTIGTGVIDISGVVNLRRGDDVQVEFSADKNGTIVLGIATNFAGTLTRVNK